MAIKISRRKCIVGALMATPAWASRRFTSGSLLPLLETGTPEVVQPKGVIIETQVHLFSDDLARFPYSSLSYKPPPSPVEAYVKFAVEAKINHTIIVQPEPYQDDHRYLEYCFAHEPFRGFFKGICLFDPIDPRTPQRMKALMQRNPGRIAALRIHELHPAGTPSTTAGAIRDRDMKDPRMLETWRAAHDLGLAMQVHSTPRFAVPIGELGAKFPTMPIILEDLLPGQSTPQEYEQLLALAKLPRVYMRFPGALPHPDAKPLVKHVYDAFGPDRIIWGVVGYNMQQFASAIQLLDVMFDFAPEAEKAKIRGLNAQKLFAFS